MENLTGYVETRIEILKHDLKEDLSRVLAKVAVLVLVLLITLFVLLFVSVAAAIAIGRELGYVAGFGIVGAVYVVAGIIVFARRVKLAHEVEQKIKEVIKQKKK